MARFGLLKHVRGLDRFGYRLDMHYQGSPVYNTFFGSLVTVLTYILILINALSISSDFVND